MKSLLGLETSPPPTAAAVAALASAIAADKAVDDLGSTASALTTAKGVIDSIKTTTDGTVAAISAALAPVRIADAA